MSDLSSYSDQQLCKIVRDGLDRLGSSADFADSMTSKVLRFGASEKQRYWLEKFAAILTGAEAKEERAKTPVGDLKGVMALFDKARQHLKSPAIVIGIGGEELRLSVAGHAARAPGTINVTTNDGYGASIWYGRILRDGQFESSPRVCTPPSIIDGLKRFAAEPAKAASEHGKLTGKCCFCNTSLTDERSTYVGYGATCAKKWDLPYPKASEVRAAKRADLFAA